MAGAVGGLLLVTAGTTYWTSMNTILHPTSDYNWVGNAEGGRMDVWRRGIGYMVHHPVTGVGLGAFPVAEGTLSPLASQQAWGVGVKWSAAHNSFVQAGAELGVFGLVAFVGLLASAFLLARRTAALGLAAGDGTVAALGDALSASFVGYAVAGFFLSQAYAAYLFAMVGILLGLGRAVAVARASAAAVAERMARYAPPHHASAHAPLAWLRDRR
jgi:O-antigen ligase